MANISNRFVSRACVVVVAWLMTALLAFGSVQPAWAQLAAGSLTVQSVPLMPDVTEDMAHASYWSAKQPDPTAVQADRAAIDALNQAGVDADGTMLQPLRAATARFYTADEQQRVKSSGESDLAYFVSEGAQDEQGNALTEAEAAQIAANYPADGTVPQVASGYAVVTSHTTMRCLPTDRMIGLTPGDADDDNLYLAALRVNEPLLVREQSVDGKFLLCTSSCIVAAWVPAADVAICKDKQEWLDAWDVPAGKELVVTGYKVRTEQSRVTPETADRMLYMGTVLERVDVDDPKDALELVGTRSAYYNHVCYLPVRGADGVYSKQLALIASSADVSEGYLPLTKQNIADQAFKALGQMYGWGGMLEANDCSGYVRDVYKCFGLELARNTTWQQAQPVRGWNLSGLDDEHKAAAIAQMPLGTVLFWGGHEMIYLGQEGDKLYVISSLGGIGNPYGDSGVYQVKGVAVNTLDMVRGNRATWLSTLTYANVPYVSAADQGPALDDIAFYEAAITWQQGTFTYTGQAIEPEVSVAGLAPGVDYAVAYQDNVEAGLATVAVSGEGAYTGFVSRTFEIGRASQAISAKKVVKKTLKASRKTGKLAKDRAIDLKELAKVSAKTEVKYEKANSAGGKKIVVGANTGEVTVKKGLKAGAYRVKVRLTAPAGGSYEAAKATTVTLKITIA